MARTGQLKIATKKGQRLKPVIKTRESTNGADLRTGSQLSEQSVRNELASPQDFPDADVVIYDGDCVFCRGQVRNLKRFDGKNRLAYLSLHDPQVSELCPNLTHEDLMKQMYVVSPDKKIFGGAAALRYLSRRLPKLWLAAPFLHIPFSLPLWQWTYDQIAKRRYKIANKNGQSCDSEGTCKIHFDE